MACRGTSCPTSWDWGLFLGLLTSWSLGGHPAGTLFEPLTNPGLCRARLVSCTWIWRPRGLHAPACLEAQHEASGVIANGHTVQLVPKTLKDFEASCAVLIQGMQALQARLQVPVHLFSCLHGRRCGKQIDCVRGYNAQAGSEANWPLVVRATTTMILLQRRRHPGRGWVRSLLRSRETFGEYHHLVRDMRLDNNQDFFQYFCMMRQRHGTFNLASMDEEDVVWQFRFTKEALPHLRSALRIPETLTTNGWVQVSGDEALSIGLRRLA
ncbi:hypothetical protein ISCGN_002543 [Ixodes scapularis]